MARTRKTFFWILMLALVALLGACSTKTVPKSEVEIIGNNQTSWAAVDFGMAQELGYDKAATVRLKSYRGPGGLQEVTVNHIVVDRGGELIKFAQRNLYPRDITVSLRGQGQLAEANKERGLYLFEIQNYIKECDAVGHCTWIPSGSGTNVIMDMSTVEWPPAAPPAPPAPEKETTPPAPPAPEKVDDGSLPGNYFD